MSALDLFTYGDQPLRVVTINGEPWFVATDVSRILGYRMASDMTRRLDPEDRGTRSARTPSGDQNLTIISEPGLYVAVLASQLPAAKAFKRWVTHEVIPAIRRHGGYLTPEATEAALTDPDFIIRLATQLKEERAARAEVEARAAEQRAQLMIAEPKASAFDRWMGSGVEYSVDVAAKALSAVGHLTGRNRLFAELSEMGWAYRAADGWHPYQQHGPEGAKRLAVRVFYFDHPGTGKATGKTTLKVTAKGIADLAVHFGVMPAAVAEALAGAA